MEMTIRRWTIISDVARRVQRVCVVVQAFLVAVLFDDPGRSGRTPSPRPGIRCGTPLVLERIVVGIAAAAHAYGDPVGLEQVGVNCRSMLHAAIGVKKMGRTVDLAWRSRTRNMTGDLQHNNYRSAVLPC
jgi:hypothetical protein